jgi:hypothetical protein
MKRLAFLLLLAGCDSAEAPPPRAKGRGVQAAPVPAPARPDPAMVAEAQAAAEALRHYYALIDSGRYREAWRMRGVEPGQPRIDYQAFVANYRRYADYGATVVPPAPAVEADGRLWVNLQVQLYGRMVDGSPVANVGSITMRRSLAGPREEQEWKIAG